MPSKKDLSLLALAERMYSEALPTVRHRITKLRGPKEPPFKPREWAAQTAETRVMWLVVAEWHLRESKNR